MHPTALTALRRVASLNPDAGEIGPGMLATIVEEATIALEYTCKYCGAPSLLDPSEQSPPPDYCHPEDHGHE